MNKRRLLKLADLLEADAKNKKGIQFDYTSWGYIADATNPASCGTRACAMGLAAVSGAFKRQGLTCGTRVGINLGSQMLLDGKHRQPIAIAQKLFDISRSDAEYLFAQWSFQDEVNGAVAERAVAKKIREFVGRAALRKAGME